MLECGKMERGIFEIVDTESLVHTNHLLRKIDAAVDFSKIYDMVEPLYCADNGRPSVDPVVLFKMVLLQPCTASDRCVVPQKNRPSMLLIVGSWAIVCRMIHPIFLPSATISVIASLLKP